MSAKYFLIASFLALLPATPAAAACPAIQAAVDAMNAGKTAEAATAATKTEGCSTQEQTIALRVAGIAAFNEIATAVAGGAPLEGFEAKLQSIQTEFASPWQVRDALGDIYRSQKNYAAASDAYQSALEIGSDESVTPDWMAPDADYIVRLDKLASEMRLLSDQPVKLASRGPCKVNFRGVTLKKKSTPVRYVFGKAEFTPEGEAAAKDLSECLRSMDAKEIVLIGHTDPVGSDEANMTLSVARADALGQYLAKAGYAGAWKVVGKGESEPFKPDDASAYTTDQLNQLNRRVEVDVQKAGS